MQILLFALNKETLINKSKKKNAVSQSNPVHLKTYDVFY